MHKLSNVEINGLLAVENEPGKLQEMLDKIKATERNETFACDVCEKET